MTRNLKGTSVVFAAGLLAFVSPSLYSQQSNFQTSFLAPVAIRPLNSGIVATIADAQHLPYMREVAKEKRSSAVSFQPTASDLLIQQAEERFRNGRKAFQEHDYERARTEFDGAIDTMLAASVN